MPGAEQWTLYTLFQIHTTLKIEPHSPCFTPEGTMPLRLLNAFAGRQLVSGKWLSWIPYIKMPLFAIFPSALMQASLTIPMGNPPSPTLNHAPGFLCSAKINNLTDSQFLLQVSPLPPDSSLSSYSSPLSTGIDQNFLKKTKNWSCNLCSLDLRIMTLIHRFRVPQLQ